MVVDVLCRRGGTQDDEVGVFNDELGRRRRLGGPRRAQGVDRACTCGMRGDDATLPHGRRRGRVLHNANLEVAVLIGDHGGIAAGGLSRDGRGGGGGCRQSVSRDDVVVVLECSLDEPLAGVAVERRVLLVQRDEAAVRADRGQVGVGQVGEEVGGNLEGSP